MKEQAELVNLESKLNDTFNELQIDFTYRSKLNALLEPLRNKDEVHRNHYLHCIRVALLAKEIAKFVHIDPKALFYAGLLHDLGKIKIPTELLGKTDTWTDEDALKMQKHVLDTYNLISGEFDFTAEIIVWHHRFQANGYPKVLPPLLHEYSEGSKVLIAECGRMLAIADVYDALHRENSKFSNKRKLSDSEIELQMYTLNPDRKKLIEDLYSAKIFNN